jgi:hypothetical protein
MGLENTLRFEKAGQRRNNVVGAFTCQVPISCGCGIEVPLLLTLISGMELVAQCKSCRTQFRIKKIAYDIGINPSVMVEVESAQPNIVVPTKM